MRIESQTTPQGLVLIPQDPQIEAASAPGFKAAMAGWIEEGHRRIVLDLARVEFIDSSGLGAILSALKGVGEGGEILLCQIHPAILRLFKLTRMDRVFHIFETRQEALDHLAGA